MKRIIILVVSFLLFTGSISCATSLTVGGTYSGIYSVVNGSRIIEGGGSIESSSLDGRLLDYLYCVDLFTNVYVNTTYSNTGVTSNGSINGELVNNVGQVAWLLDHYAIGGQGDNAMALQAAIWTVIEGIDVYHLDALHYGSDSNIVTLYNSMLTNSFNQTGNISAYLWISPGNSTDHIYQGLVTSAPVPEPATMLLLGTGLAGMLGLKRRKKN